MEQPYFIKYDSDKPKLSLIDPLFIPNEEITIED